MSTASSIWREPSFAGIMGIARRDVTPPAGIYSRSWGAAEHDVASGVHRPLNCTVLTLRSSATEKPLALAALDAGWFRGPEGAERICQHVRRELGLPSGNFMLALSHTHSGPSISPAERDKPGGHLIEGYVQRIGGAVVEAAREALQCEQDAVLAFGTGRCGIASNRDLPDPNAERMVCGFNPQRAADDACLVGRVTRGRDGATLATLVNYACHPTTLGWQNRLISPDFVGAMRETVEAATGGAPCLFLQGASGELAPRHQYAADATVADGLGRALGHAALAVLESMLPPGRGLGLESVVESGAPLAVWRPTDAQPDRVLVSEQGAVEIKLKATLRTPERIIQDVENCRDRAACERLHREMLVVRTVGSGPTTLRPLWMWRLGHVLIVGQSDEAYSQLQIDLRAAFPGHAVVVMNVVNGWGGYLCPSALYGQRLYQVDQSPYDRGCLETLISACTRGLARIAGDQRVDQSEPHITA